MHVKIGATELQITREYIFARAGRHEMFLSLAKGRRASSDEAHRGSWA